MIKAIVGPIVNPIVQAIASTPNSGSSGLTPFFFIDNMGIVQKQGGSGTLANSSTSSKTFLDNTGAIIDTEPGEIVIEGASRGQNICSYSNDFLDAAWTLAGSITKETSEHISAPGGVSSSIRNTFAIPNGETWYVSAEVKSAGLGNDLFRVFGVSSQVSGTLTATPDWVTYGITVTGDGVTSRVNGIATSSTSPMDILIRNFQVNKGTSRARYLDNTEAVVDYGYGINGVRYFNTDSSGTKISPEPQLRSTPALTNNVWPSKSTDITDYSTRANTVNRVVSQDIFTHASAVNVAGTQVELYHNDLTAAATTDYTVVVWMKMDDGSAPVVASGSTDTGGDLGLILGGDFVDASASANNSVTKFGNIYCVMMTGATLGVPTTAVNNGVIQFSGNSDKKFEVYSVGLLNGNHLFPVYIPTVSAATTWDTDVVNITSTSNFFQDEGIILVRFKPDTLSTIANKGLVSLRASGSSLIFQQSTNRIRTTDDLNGVGATSAYASGDDLIGAVIYTGVTMTIMFSVNGAAFVTVDGVYDGAYSLTGGLIRLAFNNPKVISFSSINFYHEGLSDMSLPEMKTWVESNAHKVT